MFEELTDSWQFSIDIRRGKRYNTMSEWGAVIFPRDRREGQHIYEVAGVVCPHTYLHEEEKI